MRFRCHIYDIKTFAAAVSALKLASKRAILHLSLDRIRLIAPQLDRAANVTNTLNSSANTTGGVDLLAANNGGGGIAGGGQVQAGNDTCVWTYSSLRKFSAMVSKLNPSITTTSTSKSPTSFNSPRP